MREWWSRLRGTLGARPDDLREEIDAHLEMQVRDALERGLSPEEARRRFGNRALLQESARDAWVFRSVDNLLQDLRYGMRGVRKSPGFALVVIATLTLGIGANTAIFSVVDSVLLHAVPYPNGDRLVWLGESTPKASGISLTWINYRQWRAANHTFEDIALTGGALRTLTGRGEPLLTRAGLVSSNFFRLLGVRTLAGRPFNEQEDGPGAEATVVLAYQFWAGRLGGDPNVVGQSLNLNGTPSRILGIAPPSLQFFSPPVDYYMSIGRLQGDTVQRSQHGSMRGLGLLKPRVKLADAVADLDRIMQRLAEADPGPEDDHRSYAAFLSEKNTREIRPTLVILMGAVGLVLLLACANVASLVLARSTARAGEIGVRSAIGAGRLRLIRQLLTENLLIAALGGGAGLILARSSVRALIAAGPRDIPRLADTSLNSQVLLFAVAITVFTGLFVGLAPVWTAGRFDLATVLKGISRTATGGKRGPSLRGVLVVSQIAITLVLAFASGLLLRSLIIAQNSDPGFTPGRVLAVDLALPGSSYQSPAAVQEFYQRLSADLRGLPGVTSVGSVYCPPSAGDCNDWFYSVLDRPAPPRSEVPLSLVNVADSGYFRTMQIPVREGRVFGETDREQAPLVAVVNEVFARRWWPRETAVGHRIKYGGPYLDGTTFEIVGVVGNVSQMGLDTTPSAEIYLPFAQSPSHAMVVMVRSAGDPAALIASVRRSVAAIDRNLPIRALRPFEKSLAGSLEQRRFGTTLLVLFAGLAMLLAAVGICGMLNYWVSLREGEIAIRMVLGAQRWSVVAWVGRQALLLAAAGVAIGVPASIAASRWIAKLVFGVSARNPVALACAGLVVLTLALLAAAVPVWRATHIDTAGKLHHS